MQPHTPNLFRSSVVFALELALTLKIKYPDRPLSNSIAVIVGHLSKNSPSVSELFDQLLDAHQNDDKKDN